MDIQLSANELDDLQNKMSRIFSSAEKITIKQEPNESKVEKLNKTQANCFKIWFYHKKVNLHYTISSRVDITFFIA